MFEVGTGYNFYRLDDEIVGMAKGETRDITKVYAADDENKDLAGRSVIAARHAQLREGEEAARAERRARPGHQREVQDPRRPEGRHPREARGGREVDRCARRPSTRCSRQVVETSTIPLPKSLIEYQLDTMWHDYVRETRIDEDRLVELLQAQGRDPAAMRTEMTPAAEQRAKLQLVIGEISKREQIGVEEGEIEAEIGRLARGPPGRGEGPAREPGEKRPARHPRGQPAPGEALRPHPVEVGREEGGDEESIGHPAGRVSMLPMMG